MRDNLLSLALLSSIVLLSVLLYVFHDTMNKFQWFPFWGNFKRRIYWMLKDDAPPFGGVFSRSLMYFNIHEGSPEEPRFFHGKGVQVRFRNYSFQVGFGRLLQESPWYRDLEVPVEEIKKGTEGVWTPEEA